MLVGYLVLLAWHQNLLLHDPGHCDYVHRDHELQILDVGDHVRHDRVCVDMM